MKDIDSRVQYFLWKETPRDQREIQTKEAFSKYIGYPRRTLDKWDHEYNNAQSVGYDSKKFFLSKREEIDKGMLHAVNRGNAQMAKLVKQLSGELVEKQEVTHLVLTADDYDRIRKEAKEELDRHLQRIRKVQTESNLLPEQIRQD